MLLRAQSYGTKNRVEFQGEDENIHLKAADIPMPNYLAKQDDIDMFGDYMVTIIQRIVCTHCHHFKEHYSDVVQWHIEHEYTAESKMKSETVIYFLGPHSSFVKKILNVKNKWNV